MPKRKLNKKFILGAAIVISMTVLCAGYYEYSSFHPSTDNAYIQANSIDISSEVDGKVVRVSVANNQLVKKGQVLFVIDPTQYKIALAKSMADLDYAKKEVLSQTTAIKNSESRIAEAKSEYNLSMLTNQREQALFRVHALSAQDADNSNNQIKVNNEKLTQAKNSLKQQDSALSAAKAKVKEAEQAVQKSKVDLEHTQIVAPVSGYIGNLSLNPGDFVSIGQKQFVLIDNSSWWVNANYKETDLKRIRPGQAVNINLDMYNHTYQGIVKSISSASGSTYSFLPAENASGNWTKVVQRFTVKIAVKDTPKYPLRLGASATVTINT